MVDHQSPFCTICQVKCTTTETLHQHRKSVRHRKRLLQKFYTRRRDAWTKKKDYIEITVMPPMALISDEKVRIIVEDGAMKFGFTSIVILLNKQLRH
ncbi:Zinc finger C2H2-type [Trinorchestia longiramus]|nr:Zinc finger C2H2-type [Trinorchestia longiramus]